MEKYKPSFNSKAIRLGLAALLGYTANIALSNLDVGLGARVDTPAGNVGASLTPDKIETFNVPAGNMQTDIGISLSAGIGDDLFGTVYISPGFQAVRWRVEDKQKTITNP